MPNHFLRTALAELRSSRRRPTLLASAFVAIVCLSIIAIEAWRIIASYEAQVAANEVAVTNLARSLSDHAASTFAQADTLLVALTDRLEHEGLDDGNLDNIHRLLVREMDELPQMQRLSVMNAESYWMTTDLKETNEGISHTDREYFQYHRDHRTPGPHLGPAIHSKTTDQWIVTISRRFDHPDGSFAGIVLASIDLRFFSEYYKQFDLGGDGTIVLLSADGTLLNRLPFRDDLIGRSYANAPLFRDHIAFDPAGVVWLRSAIDGVDRLTAFQRLGTFPAYAVVSFSRRHVLAAWIADSVMQAVATLILVIALGWIGGRLIAQIERRHEDQLALQASRQELEAANVRLDALARVDGLSGLANRREFDRVLSAEVKRMARTDVPLALIMIDIDRFKAYNDYFGHQKGDECLRRVSEKIGDRVSRSGDLAARYGGEEFVILLPATDTAGATAVAQKLQAAIHELALPHPRGQQAIVTASMGIGILRAGESRTPAEELVMRADKALYAAKEIGRDAIRLYERDLVAEASPA